MPPVKRTKKKRGKAIGDSSLIVQATKKKITQSKSKSSIIEISKKRSQSSARAKSLRARTKRVATFKKQKALTTTRKVVKKVTAPKLSRMVPPKLKQRINAIKMKAKQRSLAAAPRARKQASIKKAKSSVKVKGQLNKLRGKRREQAVKGKRLATTEGAKIAGLTNATQKAKLGISSINNIEAKNTFGKKTVALKDSNKKHSFIGATIGKENGVKKLQVDGMSNSRTRQAAAGSKGDLASSHAAVAKSRLASLSNQPLDVPAKPKVGANAKKLLDNSIKSEISANNAGSNLIAGKSGVKNSKSDFEAFSNVKKSVADVNSAAIMNSKNAAGIHTSRINDIKLNPDVNVKASKLKSAAGAKDDFKAKAAITTGKRKKTEADLDAHMQKGKAANNKNKAANENAGRAKAAHEGNVGTNKDIRNNLDQEFGKQDSLTANKKKAKDKITNTQEPIPASVGLKNKKGEHLEAQVALKNKKTNIEADIDKLKAKKKPVKPEELQGPTENINKLNKKKQDAISNNSDLSNKNKKLKSDIETSSNNRNSTSIMASFTTNLIGTMLGTLIPSIGPEPIVPGSTMPQISAPAAPAAPGAPATPGAPGAPATPGAPGAPAAPAAPTTTITPSLTSTGMSFNIPTPTSLNEQNQQIYNTSYRNGFETGLRDGKADGTVNVYNALKRAPSESEKQLLSKLKSLDKMDINKEVTLAEKQTYCKEVVTECLKAGIDVKTMFPGCQSYIALVKQEQSVMKGGYKEDEDGIMIYSGSILHGGALDESSGYNDGYGDGYRRGESLQESLLNAIFSTKGIIIPVPDPVPEAPPDKSPSDETPPDETPPDETPPDETPPDDVDQSGPVEKASGPIITEASLQAGGSLARAKSIYRRKNTFRRYGHLLRKIKDKTISV